MSTPELEWLCDWENNMDWSDAPSEFKDLYDKMDNEDYGHGNETSYDFACREYADVLHHMSQMPKEIANAQMPVKGLKRVDENGQEVGGDFQPDEVKEELD